MYSFDTDLADSHRRDLHHDAQAAGRARRVRNARRWRRRAERSADQAARADAQIR